MRPVPEQPTPPSTDADERMAAFEQAVRGSWRTLWSVAAAVLGSRTDAEDVVQEAIVIALGKRDEFPRVENFAAWLAQIVRFVALNRRRAARLRQAHGNNAHGELPAGDIAGPPNPLDSRGQLLSGQQLFDDGVMKALAGLEETARACLLLRVLNELSYREIAQVLGIPEGTAMSHVFRARRAMLERLWPLHGARFGGSEKRQ